MNDSDSSSDYNDGMNPVSAHSLARYTPRGMIIRLKERYHFAYLFFPLHHGLMEGRMRHDKMQVFDKS